MLLWLVVLLGLGAGTIGGASSHSSSFVLRALAELEASAGVVAMQRINVVVLNPLFLGVFMGTAALAVACAVWAMLAWPAARSLLVLAAALLYCMGCFGVTMAFNVPRNQRLAKLSATSAEALGYWLMYVREWGR